MIIPDKVDHSSIVLSTTPEKARRKNKRIDSNEGEWRLNEN